MCCGNDVMWTGMITIGCENDVVVIGMPGRKICNTASGFTIWRRLAPINRAEPQPGFPCAQHRMHVE